MNRHCIPGLTMSSPDGELLLRSVPGIIKRCTQGLARTRIVRMPTPGAGALKEKLDVMIMERLV